MLLQRLALVTAALSLAGCAAINSVSADVSSFGQWPAGRAPGGFRFERLPSQQAQPEQQSALEAAARGALERAGFRLVPDGVPPDVVVQLGARVTRYRTYWDDPWGWGPYGGGWAGWGPRYPGWRGAWMYPSPYYYDSGTTSYLHEVAVLIRDRSSGTPLYEARATAEEYGGGGGALTTALYDAALQDFPTPAISPRRVRVPLAP